MNRLHLAALVAACVIWALAVFAGVDIQAAWRRVRGLPDLDERFV